MVGFRSYYRTLKMLNQPPRTSYTLIIYIVNRILLIVFQILDGTRNVHWVNHGVFFFFLVFVQQSNGKIACSIFIDRKLNY